MGLHLRDRDTMAKKGTERIHDAIELEGRSIDVSSGERGRHERARERREERTTETPE